ncbi:tRNA threonylcarbamoyladenosine biosynthesis protein TsaE [Loktanella sp. DSM 29012]|uniref:tRNA (adenosine(37)-N6)-threonylcarbamoyltransferase complex ATPase subunit type 1 TsaE n=1 Tax=Loktanella sp. DSM 29012 TaxID=1881056 RepID=UPI0008C8843B|nr:tRNA (adenosine(37)-N6)-threonylcarbamoyltransferase complex ATPase subunit type 1 TsaE [Loktanella sp. DSM 29012]SEP61392.1 tRNA threonylcarbamoyladenosine biosynthesis protein TsaE [Loktanella sp. DSM 29012]
MSTFCTQITLPDLAKTEALAAQFAAALDRGDTLLLSGDIGAGKTTFARAFIRNRLRRMEDVPSPTFTLVQTYDDGETEIWHCDLYRLTSADEVLELGLEDAFEDAICLIEWPDRLGQETPGDALTCHFTAATDHHTVTLTGPERWQQKLGWLND